MPDLFPPDLDRLHAIRTYLQVQLEAVQERIDALDPPDGWRLQSRRTPVGQARHAVLHRGGCWVGAGSGARLSLGEAVIALGEEAVRACDVCRPEELLPAATPASADGGG